MHASLQPLKKILVKCQEYPNHKLVFLGDYFDYGTKLKETLNTLINLDQNNVFLYGNHDWEFLQFLEKHGNSKSKRKEILNHFSIGEEHVYWLSRFLKFSYQTKSAFFSHSGVDDRLPLEKQTIQSLLSSSFRGNLDHVTNKLIIQGHLPMRKIKKMNNHWFLDTGCGQGGTLSALVYPEFKILNSKCSSKL
nr:metallophosphoesterase [Leptospira ellinghausenii]